MSIQSALTLLFVALGTLVFASWGCIAYSLDDWFTVAIAAGMQIFLLAAARKSFQYEKGERK